MASTGTYTNTDNNSIKRGTFKKLLKGVCFVSLPFLLALAWLESGRGPWLRVFTLVIYALLVFSLGEALSILPVKRSRVYRSAYLTGILVAVSRWAFPTLTTPLDLFSVILAAFGAFLGGLLATSLRWGLYENYPPTRELEAEVLEYHQHLLNSIRPTPFYKRTFDIGLATFGLILSSPVWLMIAWLTWLEDPGPLLFVKNSVGKTGRNIKLFKFRTMQRESGKAIGPYYVSKEDSRVLRFGQIFRKTAMDELPQLMNILLGDISFVGPRPHRIGVVSEYLAVLPEFAERHQVIPGLAGLAQVVGGNSLTPRQKLRLDRLYIRHASSGFDIKLLLLAFSVVFYLRWKKDWDGRVPRRWMRFHF